MSVTFQFDLVTLEETLLSQEEVIITVPGAEGYFGVLPGHAPFVALLTAGVLTVGEGGEAVRYALSGGYAEVSPTEATILADRAMRWDNIDPVVVRAEQTEAERQFLRVLGDEEAEAYWKKRQDFAEVCLSLHDLFLSRTT